MSTSAALTSRGVDCTINDFAPFIGYVVVYRDAEEHHCGILEHVEWTTIDSPKRGAHRSDVSFYLSFKGRNEDVEIWNEHSFILEMFR